MRRVSDTTLVVVSFKKLYTVFMALFNKRRADLPLQRPISRFCFLPE